MTKLSRPNMSVTDSAIATHAANRATAIHRLEETEARIAEVRQQINADEFDVGRAAELIAGGEFEIPQVRDVSGLRGELSRLESAAAALHLGIEKIEAAIAARETELDEEFLRKVTSSQVESLNGLFEAMLVMAELAQNEKSLKSAAPPHLAVRIKQSHAEFWRTPNFFPVSCVTSSTARGYIEVFSLDIKNRFGFDMSSKQAARLASLEI